MSAWLHLGVVGLALALVGCGDGETPPEVETCPDNLVAISGSASGQCEPNFYLGAALRGKHAAGQHAGAGASRGVVGERAAAEHHPIGRGLRPITLWRGGGHHPAAAPGWREL